MDKLKSNMAHGLAVLVVGLLYFLFHFLLPYSFNSETDINEHYLVVCIAAVALFVSTFCYRGEGLGLAVMVSVVFFMYGAANEYAGLLFSIAVVSWLLFIAGVDYLDVFSRIFVLFWLYELFVAFQQLRTGDGSHEITGTLHNSGVFAIYLVVNIPFWQLCVYSRAGLKWLRRTIFFAVVLFCLGLIVYVRSRTALIGFFAVSLTLFAQDKWPFFKRKMASLAYFNKMLCILFALAAGGGISYYLFGLKKMSSYGRVLMAEVAWRHMGEVFWTGTGIGRYTWYYPQWQADYFRSVVKPPLEFFLSAGESYVVFNEYVQLFGTIGLFGFLVFLLLLYWFFTSRSSEHAPLLNAAKATMTGILACGFTSYPFHVNGLLILTSFCFITAAIVRDGKIIFPVLPAARRKNWMRGALYGVIIITSGLAAFQACKQYSSVREWQYLRDRSSSNRKEVKEKYEELSEVLNSDGKFLTEYGEYLSADPEDCKQAVRMLEAAKKRFISRKTMEATGYAYKQLKNYPKAIENFEWVSDYLPGNFSSKLELLKLYKLSGDFQKARSVGHRILTMAVKIPSEEVDRIKLEATEILKTI